AKVEPAVLVVACGRRVAVDEDPQRDERAADVDVGRTVGGCAGKAREPHRHRALRARTLGQTVLVERARALAAVEVALAQPRPEAGVFARVAVAGLVEAAAVA